MSKNKYVTKLLCPVCGTELHITNQREVKCLCLTKFHVIRNGKDKKLVQKGEEQAANVAMKIKCKNCLDFFPQKNSSLGDCLSIAGMKRNIDGNCIRICKRFRRK